MGLLSAQDDPYRAIYEGRLDEVRRPFRMLDERDMRPDSLYGVSKAFGEVLGSYYQDEYGLSVICLRIGWVMTPDDPTFHPAALSLWMSHRDTAQLISKAIDAPRSVGFAIVYGMSRNDSENLGHRDGRARHRLLAGRWRGRGLGGRRQRAGVYGVGVLGVGR